MTTPTPKEAADRVDSVLRHADLTTVEVEAVRLLRDHARMSDTYAEEREQVRLAWNRMCQHPALAGPPYDADTRVDRVLGALDQSRATEPADGGERAALIPSLEAALFAPLTEARWSTLDDRLRPLIGRLLGEWAGAPKPGAATRGVEDVGCHSPEQEATELCECGAHVVPLVSLARDEKGPAESHHERAQHGRTRDLIAETLGWLTGPGIDYTPEELAQAVRALRSARAARGEGGHVRARLLHLCHLFEACIEALEAHRRAGTSTAPTEVALCGHVQALAEIGTATPRELDTSEPATEGGKPDPHGQELSALRGRAEQVAIWCESITAHPEGFSPGRMVACELRDVVGRLAVTPQAEAAAGERDRMAAALAPILRTIREAQVDQGGAFAFDVADDGPDDEWVGMNLAALAGRLADAALAHRCAPPAPEVDRAAVIAAVRGEGGTQLQAMLVADRLGLVGDS